MLHTLNLEEMQFTNIIKHLTHHELLHVVNVLSHALIEMKTFKQAYYDLCPPISSKYLNNAYQHGQIHPEIADIVDKQSLTKMLFYSSMRLMSLTIPQAIQQQTVFASFEPGWTYMSHVKSERVNSYCIYNADNMQTGTCFKYRDRPDLDSVDFTDGIDYKTMVTTVMVAQLNCGCNVSL